MISRRTLLLGAAAAALLPSAVLAQGKKGPKGGEGGAQPDLASGPPIIDTHCHLQAAVGPGRFDWDGAARAAIAHMDKLGIRRTLIQPPPQPHGFDNPYDLEFAATVKRYGDRFAMVAGGGSLNPMINRRRADTTLSESVLRDFDAAAARIADAGAVGFGELTCEHFSGMAGHPYVSAPPDHPLFLRLADIAAARDLPIDMHMEALPADMDMPASFRRSSANPAKVGANIERFERLLAHNRKARIVWVHLGWDVTGHRTAELTRALLGRNENLFMQLRPLPPPQAGQAQHPLHNFVLSSDMGVEPAWARLMMDFPDRFVIGTDSFYVTPSGDPRIRFAPPLPFARVLVNRLPPQIAAKVAHENAVRLYRLPAV